MANPEIPFRELYGTTTDDSLRCDDPYEAIDQYIQGFFGPITEETTAEIVCANYKRDEDGEMIEFDGDDSLYELTDVVEVVVKIREWCRENDAMELLEEYD